MEIVAIVVAGLAAWGFGAGWYMALARPWMAASRVPVRDGRPANAGNPMPFLVSAALLVAMAGMMQHVLVTAQIEEVGKAAVTGLGLGLFLATPWIAMANLFGMRPLTLTLIDGGYATLGCAIAATVLALF